MKVNLRLKGYINHKNLDLFDFLEFNYQKGNNRLLKKMKISFQMFQTQSLCIPKSI